jgi:DNA primase catalytic core
MIEKDKIEAIKHGVDLAALVQAKGIALKKNGKSWFGLCPFHNDKNPSLSINPGKNLFQCFGCGAAGDVIRFVELFDQLGLKEAVKRLSDNGLQATASKPRRPVPAQPPGLAAKLQKLLARVIEFYHTAFGEDPRARQYLEKRGITDNAVLSAHKAGFANGTLLNVLPTEGEVKSQLKQLGILNERGKEHFYGCATIPLYDAGGNPAGIYGWRIDEAAHPGSARHLYLTGERLGLFNRQAARAHKQIILTESVIDSLTLINAGIHNTIPTYGINGFTEDHLQWLKTCNVETVHICFDADEAGRQAAEKTAARLESEGFTAHRIDLAEAKDINDFFLLTADAAAVFKELIGADDPSAARAVKEKNDRYTVADFGFTATIDGRHYEARGITKRDTKLKATIKGIAQNKGRQRFHVDTVDFYSARSRVWLVKDGCLFDPPPAGVCGQHDLL